VFVAGRSWGSKNYDYATVAYDASTGSRLWLKRYEGPSDGADEANALELSPDGSALYVSGSSYGGKTTKDDYATVAYALT
jgi:hypothetical protein